MTARDGSDVAPVTVLAVRGDHIETRPDRVVGEEPLQIRAVGPGQDPVDVAVTMRTPGHEEELAAGFLISEGLCSVADLVAATFHFGDPARMAQPHDDIVVRLPAPFDASAVAERHFVATASCGICGRASMDELVARVDRLPDGPVVGRTVLASLPATMRAAQAVFEHTGGLHASALFTTTGALIALREDVGRHNALDKLIGSQVLSGKEPPGGAQPAGAGGAGPVALPTEGAMPLGDRLLLVSGRVSFEIVQKAAAAGIPVLCAVSAPSDLAVTTAERLGMTLVGFLRGDGFNVYSGTERIDLTR